MRFVSFVSLVTEKKKSPAISRIVEKQRIIKYSQHISVIERDVNYQDYILFSSVKRRYCFTL